MKHQIFWFTVILAGLAFLLTGGAGAQDENGRNMTPGTPGTPANAEHDHDLLMLRRQVEFQNKELQQLRTRHSELRRAVQQALTTLKARPKTNGDDPVTALLERALAAAAPGEAATGARKTGTSPAPAPAPTPGSTATPGNTSPPAAQASPGDFHVPGFAFTKVTIKESGQGAVCTGRLTNQSMRDEVITAKFRLTTYDDQGQELEQATFFMAFADIEETKTFSVDIKKVPPTGRFKIERLEEQ